MHDPDDIPTPPSDDDHEALAREHAARVEAARLHHAAEAQLPVPGALAASLDGLLAGLRVAVVDPVHEARVQAERRAREARERRTLRALADARDIPADELLRAVALDPCPERTSALRLAGEVDVWRGRRRIGALRVLSGVPGVGKSAGLAWCCLWGPPHRGPRAGGPVGTRLGARAPHRLVGVRGAVGAVAAGAFARARRSRRRDV